MGILNSIFGNKNNKTEMESNVNWIPFQDLKQLQEIKEMSYKEPVLIFKHSTRCGISRMVLKQFEKSFTEDMKLLKVFYIDLLSYRNISNEVGYEFQVIHQSPQLLIIKNGEAISYASHYDITQLPIKSLTK